MSAAVFIPFIAVFATIKSLIPSTLPAAIVAKRKLSSYFLNAFSSSPPASAIINWYPAFLAKVPSFCASRSLAITVLSASACPSRYPVISVTGIPNLPKVASNAMSIKASPNSSEPFKIVAYLSVP